VVGAGVKRVVRLSVVGAAHDAPNRQATRTHGEPTVALSTRGAGEPERV
jgi:hypothetical protein